MNKRCPKCASARMELERWCSGSSCSHKGERLHVRCPACGYGTTVPCADAEEDATEDGARYWCTERALDGQLVGLHRLKGTAVWSGDGWWHHFVDGREVALLDGQETFVQHGGALSLLGPAPFVPPRPWG